MFQWRMDSPVDEKPRPRRWLCLGFAEEVVASWSVVAAESGVDLRHVQVINLEHAVVDREFEAIIVPDSPDYLTVAIVAELLIVSYLRGSPAVHRVRPAASQATIEHLIAREPRSNWLAFFVRHVRAGRSIAPSAPGISLAVPREAFAIRHSAISRQDHGVLREAVTRNRRCRPATTSTRSGPPQLSLCVRPRPIAASPDRLLTLERTPGAMGSATSRGGPTSRSRRPRRGRQTTGRASRGIGAADYRPSERRGPNRTRNSFSDKSRYGHSGRIRHDSCLVRNQSIGAREVNTTPPTPTNPTPKISFTTGIASVVIQAVIGSVLSELRGGSAGAGWSSDDGTAS